MKNTILPVSRFKWASAICVLVFLAVWRPSHLLAEEVVGPVVGNDPGWRVETGLLRRQEVDLQERVNQQVARGQFAAAARTYGRMANLATRRVNAAWATMHKGEAQIAAGRLWQAAGSYKSAIQRWPGEINFRQAINRLREIAEALATQPSSILGVIPVSRTDQAIELYKFIVEHAPSGPNAAADAMRLAELQLQERQTEAAMASFKQVYERHPRSDEAPRAAIKYIDLLLERARRAHGHPQMLAEAREEARGFLRRHPRHELAGEAENMLRESEELLAAYYLELAAFHMHPVRSQVDSARRYLNIVIERFGNTAAAPKANEMLRQLDNPAGNSPSAGNSGSNSPAGNSAASEDFTYTEEDIQAMEIIPVRLRPLSAAPLPAFSSLAVVSVRNHSMEPELGTVFQRQLHEEIMREETVALQSADNADLWLEVRIHSLDYRASASARIRREQDLPDSLSTHSTTIYTASLNLDYQVLTPNREVLIEWQSVGGEADFPAMPDMAMSRETAIRQSASDAARKLMHSIVDSW